MWRRGVAFLLTALLAGSPPAALAADEASDSGDKAAAEPDLRDFCAERPGKATPACIVDQGHWQVELGVVDATFQNGGGQSVDTWTVGEINLRRGLTHSLEAHIDWAPFTTIRVHDQLTGATLHSSGVNDVEFGLRQSLTDPDSKGVAIAIEPFVTAPTGTHGMSAGGFTTGMLLPVSAPLPAGLSLGLTPEVDLSKNAAGDGNHVTWTGVAALGRSFGPIALGAELWASRDEDPSGYVTQASFDLTTAWTPKSLPATQFDLSLYFGLNRETPDVELAAGVAKRF